MTYEEYQNSGNRDEQPIVLLDRAPRRLYFDRFFKVFVLPDAGRIIPVEEIIDLARRAT